MAQQRDNILDIPVDFVTKKDVFKVLAGYFKANSNHLVVTPYASFWYWADQDDGFKQALKNSDLSLPDGIGLFAAKYILSQHYSTNFFIRLFQVTSYGMLCGFNILTGQIESNVSAERITGVDLVSDLLGNLESEGKSVYFLGGWNDTLRKLDDYLRKTFPDLRYKIDVGSEDVRSEQGKNDLKNTIEKINEYKPHLLLVAFGPPFQEKWSHCHLDELDAKVTMCVGATFDLLSGTLKRAPLVVRQIGMEWVWRLLTQPKRVKRILAAFPWFPLKVATHIIFRK